LIKFFFLLLTSLLLAGCLNSNVQLNKLQELKGEVFGSHYIIRYHGPLDKTKFTQKLEQFFNEFNYEFSTYQKNSIISSFNQLPAHTKLKVSPRFIQMLNLARQFHQDTQGALDPTLGPVIQVWRSGSPTQADLANAMSKVGMLHLKWDEGSSHVWKTREGLELNINAFAPGWAADLIGSMLQDFKINDFMIDISGEILFKGTKPDGAKWIAGIERPSAKYAKGVQIAFYVKDLAIATSGDYRQKSHIIDPRTGRPVNHTISSATIITQTAASADAWSTAMMVLGADGIELAEKNGKKIFLLRTSKADEFTEVVSPSMKNFLEASKL
jgi:thiamine biosynthesis lipoprotein